MAGATIFDFTPFCVFGWMTQKENKNKCPYRAKYAV